MLEDGMEMGQQKNAASFPMSRLIQTSSMNETRLLLRLSWNYVKFNLSCI